MNVDFETSVPIINWRFKKGFSQTVVQSLHGNPLFENRHFEIKEMFSFLIGFNTNYQSQTSFL